MNTPFRFQLPHHGLYPGGEGALGVGLLSGGYSRQEHVEVGAYRVFDDPEALRVHLDELGIRR